MGADVTVLKPQERACHVLDDSLTLHLQRPSQAARHDSPAEPACHRTTHRAASPSYLEPAESDQDPLSILSATTACHLKPRPPTTLGILDTHSHSTHLRLSKRGPGMAVDLGLDPGVLSPLQTPARPWGSLCLRHVCRAPVRWSGSPLGPPTLAFPMGALPLSTKPHSVSRALRPPHLPSPPDNHGQQALNTDCMQAQC